LGFNIASSFFFGTNRCVITLVLSKEVARRRGLEPAKLFAEDNTDVVDSVGSSEFMSESNNREEFVGSPSADGGFIFSIFTPKIDVAKMTEQSSENDGYP